MSEDDLSDFDENFIKVRSKIASENLEWVKLFKKRNKLLASMIISVFLVNLILIIFEFYLGLPFDPVIFGTIPNIFWFITCLPFFYFKLIKLSRSIELKREEAVISFYRKKKNIKDIAMSTGMRVDYVEYYLKKNNLDFESIDFKSLNKLKS